MDLGELFGVGGGEEVAVVDVLAPLCLLDGCFLGWLRWVRRRRYHKE